jgi:uncharacterized RDD family membrane protein YckC
MHALDGADLASFGRRAVAFTIDFLIGGAIFMSPLVILSLIFFFRGADPNFQFTVGEPREGTIRLNFFGNAFSIVYWLFYFGLATYFGNGRTPGKRIMKIRVVSLVHERISLWHSIERALGYAASALEFGFGFMQYFVHPNRRTVHDRIAETIVVDERPARAVELDEASVSA